MTSTRRRTSWRATSSFSAAVRPAPGACSPSRRVVSKMRRSPRDERTGGYGYRRHQWAFPVLLDAAAWAWPARTVTGSRTASRPAGRPRPARSGGRGPAPGGARTRAAGLVLGDPAGREGPVLDVGEDRPHRGPDAFVDDPRPGDVVPVLRGVADAEAHEVETPRYMRSRSASARASSRSRRARAGSRLHERLEGHLHEGRRAAAEDALLAEEVGLVSSANVVSRMPARVFAKPAGVGEDAGAGGPGGVLVDGKEGRHAAALSKTERTRWPGPLGATSRRRRRRAARIRP